MGARQKRQSNRPEYCPLCSQCLTARFAATSHYKAHTFLHDRWISGAVKFSGGTAAVDGIPEWKEGESRPGEDCWFIELNPRIRLADGSAIWGDECFWGDAATAPATLSDAQTELEQHKILLRAMASALATEEK